MSWRLQSAEKRLSQGLLCWWQLSGINGRHAANQSRIQSDLGIKMNNLHRGRQKKKDIQSVRSHLRRLSHKTVFPHVLFTWSMFSVSMDSILWPYSTVFFSLCALLWIPILGAKTHCQYCIHNCCYFPQDVDSHIRNNPRGTHLDNRPIQTACNSHLTVTLLLWTDFKMKNREIGRSIYRPHQSPLLYVCLCFAENM